MLIDVHNHPDWIGRDLEKFVANMDECGIDRTWILSWECPQDEYDPSFVGPVLPPPGRFGPIPFERCLAYKERAPERFVLGYAPDPRRWDALGAMRAAIEIHGVRVYGELKVRMMFDDLDALRMYRFCGERKVPVLVHVDYQAKGSGIYPRPDYWYGGGIEPLDRALAACPDTSFIGHGPGFWSHISDDDQASVPGYPKGPVAGEGKLVAMLRRRPNLFCDLSAGSGLNALTRDTAFAVRFLTEFQDRICFGRDYFDKRLKDFLDGAGLPAAALGKICSGNALRLVPDDPAA